MATLATLNTSWSFLTPSTQHVRTLSDSAPSTPVVDRHDNPVPSPVFMQRQNSTQPSPSSSQSESTTNGANTSHAPSGSVDNAYVRHPSFSSRKQTPFPAPHQPPQWVPSPNAPVFYPQYPSYFPSNGPMNVHPKAYHDPSHHHHQQQQQQAAAVQQQHFAQWAYQQMLYNAQQQQIAAAAVATDYNVINHGRNSSSPMVHPHHSTPHLPSETDLPQAQSPVSLNSPSPIATQPPGHPQNTGPYQGFHPYRRPGPGRTQPNSRSNSHNQETFPKQQNSGSGSGKSNNVPSTNPQNVLERPRTNSNRSSDRSSVSTPSTRQQSRPEVKSPTSINSSRPPGARSDSTSSSAASTKALAGQSPVATSQSTSTSVSSVSARRPVKPSPLSQNSSSLTAEERASRRISRDDSELSYSTGNLSGVSNHVTRTGGLKGRLRRALTLNAQANAEGKDKAIVPSSGSRSAQATPSLVKSNEHSGDSSSPPHTPTSPTQDTIPSARGPPGKVKSKSLFNLRFNASTDNISLSSTVSSASVMIRKIGNMGKIARRSSIAGITKLFKDKKKKGEVSDDTQDDSDDEVSTMRGSKSAMAEASISHATVEFDRGMFSTEDLKGLSPAARLARQHTLKSRAADAMKAQQVLDNERTGDPKLQAESNGELPVTWERGTAKRNNQASRVAVVGEDGVSVFGNDQDDSDEDTDEVEEEEDVTLTREEQWRPALGTIADEQHSEEDDDDYPGEEDVTIRLGSLVMQDVSKPLAEHDQLDDEMFRKIPPKGTRPVKGILKHAANFDQTVYLENSINPKSVLASQSRIRANSYSAADHSDNKEPGAMTRIPSPDPDHIDGLHKSDHPRVSLDEGRLPDFSFEFSPSSLLNSFPGESPAASGAPDRSIFNLPSLNSSAPVLSSLAANHAPAPVPRNISPRRITFAVNLSVYDTFPPSIYDRRCEPVTCNRLTPALAQRIKEELNTYKMEEMEVHSASRIHTHFFV